MNTSRVLLMSILLAAVVYVGGFVALGSSVPTINSSGEEVLAWFVENGDKARIYAWTATFMSLGLAIFGGIVAKLLPSPHRYVFFAGVLGWIITAQVQAWFWAGLAFHPEGLDPETARTIFNIPAYWGPIINGSTMTMAIAIASLGTGKSPLIPRWLMWLSIVFLLEQGIETITVFGQNGFIAPNGPMNVYLGGIIGFIWAGGVVHWASSQLKAKSKSKK